MALKPCPRCGSKISDKATRCPQCGMELSKESFSANINRQQGIQTQSESLYPNVDNSSRNKLWMMIVLPIIILGIIAGCILYFGNESGEYRAVKLAERARLDSRRDALKAEKEKAEMRSHNDEVGKNVSLHPDLKDGWNTFHGSFNFEGAEYPFVVEFYYDASTLQVNEAKYIATGTGSINKITSLSFSDHDNNVTIVGPSLNISASLDTSGKYIGTMTRGTHSGTIEMSL